MDPVALVAIVVGFLLYAVGLVKARRRGASWPVHRALGFCLLGLGSYAWISFGFLGAYSVDLRWAFTTRIALLIVVVPGFISLGKPLALARAATTESSVRKLDHFLSSWLIRLTGNAVFEAVFTFCLFLVFLTPFSGLVRENIYAQWAITLFIPLIGLLTVLPIVEKTAQHSSFFVTVEFVLAFVALIFDAIPGILLRINETVLDQIASPIGVLPDWFPTALRDQQLSGDILWFLAETLDVPILLILLIRWKRLDRKEAKSLDNLSDEEMDALTQAHLREFHRR